MSRLGIPSTTGSTNNQGRSTRSAGLPSCKQQAMIKQHIPKKGPDCVPCRTSKVEHVLQVRTESRKKRKTDDNIDLTEARLPPPGQRG